ncbi:MAG: hypothetical protein JSR91_16825 [Proteobacteria bacterium]|nr:hypothetical protein [Pseudomonadota bacterium]
MAQVAWPTFTAKRKHLHLVVVEVPLDVSENPRALLDLLVKLVKPSGDFALSGEKMAAGMRLFCAFADPSDADMMVEAINAQEDNVYSGWASEYHCQLNKAEAAAIRCVNYGT